MKMLVFRIFLPTGNLRDMGFRGKFLKIFEDCFFFKKKL